MIFGSMMKSMGFQAFGALIGPSIDYTPNAPRNITPARGRLLQIAAF